MHSVRGTVTRSHAGGYLVHSDELSATFQCAARGRLKKERVSIITGDRVLLEEIDTTNQAAVIASVLERETMLSRPLIANVEQAVIVQAVHQPEWNPLLCDRYLIHCQLELPGKLPIVCLNKCDLAAGEDLWALQKIYAQLGYDVLTVSAVTGDGIDELIDRLSGKISVLAGPSGVGKSSLINDLDPDLHLKVGVMENEFGVGRHTTTYSELYRIKLGQHDEHRSSWVADTPGFSIAELKHPEPHDVDWQFPEIIALAEQCKYSDCLHLVEQGCNILANIDNISPTRYQSYCQIVSEAQNEARARKDTSQKVEGRVKLVGGDSGRAKVIPKLSGKYRAASRRTEKQQVASHADDEELDMESDK